MKMPTMSNETTKDGEFVTVVAIESVSPLRDEQFVTILSIGNEERPACSDSEEVLVYRLPGERLGFGLKFDGGANATEKVTKLMIQSCALDSPASRTTVSWGHFNPGDEIVEIDDTPVVEMTRMECVRALKESNVCLKLKVRKGDERCVRTGNTSNKPKPVSVPPVPPRKYPRRAVKNPPSPPTAAIVRPPDGFNDSEGSVLLPAVKFREKMNVPEPLVYTDLISQEMNAVACTESESDDTGSSLSTVVVTPTVSNSTFSDVRSTMSVEIESSCPSSNVINVRNRKIDLDRVLEPFLQLEREFSSCATIKDHDLFQKLVAVASVNEENTVDPPDFFQDKQRCYQKVVDDENNNTFITNVTDCGAAIGEMIARSKTPEEPPKPLPRKEIPTKVMTTKYGKKRPPPPPPSQANENSNRYPTPRRESNAGHHESSDSDVSVDRLPRLIDFVPKDRGAELVVPSAVHPNPMDMLLERQRILNIVSQSAVPNSETSNDAVIPIDDESQRSRELNASKELGKFLNHGMEIQEEICRSSSYTSIEQKEIAENKVESKPDEMCTHAEHDDPEQNSTNFGNMLNDRTEEQRRSTVIRTAAGADSYHSNSMPTMSESLQKTIKSHETTANYAMLPCDGEDVKKMKPLLALSTSVNLNLPNSPPAYSRMPPDGHEFPQTYRELYQTAEVYETAAEEHSPSSAGVTAKRPVSATYTDVFNEAKLLDVERVKMPEKGWNSKQRRNGLWRNDERSERSVKDKIAMFSNVVDSAPATVKIVGKSRSEDVADRPLKAFSKSVFAVNTVGKCKRSTFGEPNDSNDVNINRTQSSIDLTLFSSSCSSAYSSCSPDSSLSPMSSPSYTIGSSSTLPRKLKSAEANPMANKTHQVLARATSFTGTGSAPLHTRSQSLVDVLHVPANGNRDRKDSLTTLIEQRRRTMSKLRGLVIPEKSVAESAPLKPIIDLPEIKSQVTNGLCGMATTNQPLQKTRHETMSSSSYIECTWKSVLNNVDIPKYSPAFKRKMLAVYGVSSSASSLSSSLNSSREELRDSVARKPAAPAKPPRGCNNQLLYGPTMYKSTFGKQNSVQELESSVSKNKKEENVAANRICRYNDFFKMQEDSDNDSAVSSSRSSLCQEYSPPSSPPPNTLDYENANERVSAESPSQSSSRTLRRTLSSETNASLTSSVSTLTSGSQTSSGGSSGSEDAYREQSKRVLKAESVEAINRKNVLSSAKYSCGKDFKIGSPLIKDVYEGGQRFNEPWFDYEKLNINAQSEPVKIAYLEVQDGEESDYSAKENSSSSVDTDEALDKSIDSTDSLCGNYGGPENILEAKKAEDSYSKIERGTFEKAQKNNPNKILVREKTYDRCEPKLKITNGECGRKSVSDIKKAFEKDAKVTTTTTTTTVRKTPPIQNHLRMSSTDSTTSEDSFPSTNGHGLNANLLKEQQFGSITSLASSTSLISQQELQQLIDEANHTLEETAAGSGEHDLMVVILHRDTVMSSIGITLAGGADYEAKEITVHKILVGSPADKDGRIQKGDRILSINGRSMKGVTHREALSILKAPRPEVVLVASRWKPDGSSAATAPVPAPAEVPLVATFKNTLRPARIPEVVTDCDTKETLSSTSSSNNCNKAMKGPVTAITINKEGGGLGFSLEGGKDSPSGDLPLTVKKIFTGGCAAKSGALAAGDELISLNGIDVTSMSRTEAWNMMKRLSDGRVMLNIRKSIINAD